MIKIKTVKVWWQAVRFHFTFPTFLPVMLGTIYALLETNQWHPLPYLAVLIATIFHHIGLNLADDYFDYQHGADLLQNTGKNLYAGGSGVLTSKAILPYKIKLAAILCYGVTILIGLVLVYLYGYWILYLGFFGIFSSFYYAAPPLKLAYRGLGELLIWLNFGPVLVLGSYFIQSKVKYSIGAFLLSIIIGTAIFSLIIANEIPDYENDLIAGKKTLIVYFGKKFGIIALIFSMVVLFITIIVGITTKVFPIITIISFLAVPLSYLGIKKLTTTMNTKQIYGNEFIVAFCNVLGILLILSFIVNLFINKKFIPGLIITITTILFYLPILMFRPKLPK